MSFFDSAPDYKSPIDELFEKINNEDEFNAKKHEIVAYIDEKNPTKETTEEPPTEGPPTEGPPTEGGKKKRKSKKKTKKTKKMKKSKKSKTAKKKKH